MDLWLQALDVLLPLIDLVLWGGYVLVFLEDRPRVLYWTRRVYWVALAAHLGEVVLFHIVHGHAPMASPLQFSTMLALCILVIYKVVEKRMRVRQTGFLVLGFVFVLQFFHSAFSTGTPQESRLLEDPGYVGHAVLVLMAYTALTLSFLYAILYMVQLRQLKTRSFGLAFRRLPPLDTLERMSVGAATLGVPLLFAALATGHLWLYSLADRLDPADAARLTPFDPKVISSWIIFLVYLVGLIGHRWWGWRGRRMNVMAVTVFIVVVVMLGVVHHFFPSFHDFSLREGA